VIFIVPIILGAAALITAGFGVAAGVDGVSKIEAAKRIGKEAQDRYERERKSLEDALQMTQALAEEYGQLQIQIKLQTIERFVAFVKRLGQEVSQSDMKFLEGLEGASPQQIQEYETAVLDAKQFAAGGVTALGAAYAAGQGTVALVGLFGTASTGAAISGLSGAAAWNATLAWLGGGSLAAGGGGMALGSLVLGGIAVGPALMIGGFVLGGEGEKALTEAHRYQAEVNTEIAKLDAFKDFLGQVQRRITELEDLLKSLNDKAINSLMELEAKPFVPAEDAAKFQQVVLLIKALVEIMKTPVLDAEGKLNSATAGLKAKYRTI
jgi:TolA-binding protein